MLAAGVLTLVLAGCGAGQNSAEAPAEVSGQSVTVENSATAGQPQGDKPEKVNIGVQTLITP